MHDTNYVTSMFLLPSITQVLAGIAMILASRLIGRWLCNGLDDAENDRGAYRRKF